MSTKKQLDDEADVDDVDVAEFEPEDAAEDTIWFQDSSKIIESFRKDASRSSSKISSAVEGFGNELIFSNKDCVTSDFLADDLITPIY